MCPCALTSRVCRERARAFFLWRAVSFGIRAMRTDRQNSPTDWFVIAEAEHGYASTMPMPDDMRTVTKRPKTKKSQGSRLVSSRTRQLRSFSVFTRFSVQLHVSDVSFLFLLFALFLVFPLGRKRSDFVVRNNSNLRSVITRLRIFMYLWQI